MYPVVSLFVAPFDGDALSEDCQHGEIVLNEPYFSGVLVPGTGSTAKNIRARVEEDFRD